jgi:hypothetical protein
MGYDTSFIVTGLQKTRINGGPVERSKLDQVLREINADRKAKDRYVSPDDKLESIKAVFDTEEKVKLFMKRCSEPLIRGNSGGNQAAIALEELVDFG